MKGLLKINTFSHNNMIKRINTIHRIRIHENSKLIKKKPKYRGYHINKGRFLKISLFSNKNMINRINIIQKSRILVNQQID